VLSTPRPDEVAVGWSGSCRDRCVRASVRTVSNAPTPDGDKPSPHTTLTILTRSLCDLPESDDVVHSNIDLVGVYLATLTQVVINAQLSVPRTYDRPQRTDCTIAAFQKALQRKSDAYPSRRSIQGEALARLSVALRPPVALVQELLPVLRQVHHKSPDTN